MAPTNKTLTYVVHKWSSYSGNYYPENIQLDNPYDQSSRWSSDTNTPPQFLILRLQRPAIVDAISFGKFEKTHVCNLKKFKIYAGMDEDHLTEVLEGGLRNDPNAESFKLKHEIEIGLEDVSEDPKPSSSHSSRIPLPTQFIKILPLQPWGPSFNFSIWYVELRGCDDPEVVNPLIEQIQVFREREAIRLCLKHLRERNCIEAFESLQKKTRVQLEDPVLSRLYSLLVTNGDFEGAEHLIASICGGGLFQEFIERVEYKAQWERIEPVVPVPATTATTMSENFETPMQISHDDGTNEDEETMPLQAIEISPEEIEEGSKSSRKKKANSTPCMRGGHQMCLDPLTETIYLFGGWDGRKDLSDFWTFHIPSRTWTLLSNNTEAEGGPSPRSCHKMCMDPERRQIFTIGRYIDSLSLSRPSRNSLKSDFYMYDMESKKWTLITEDTATMGGPSLVFDHQIAIDVKKRTIFVFGGRILSSPPESNMELIEASGSSGASGGNNNNNSSLSTSAPAAAEPGRPEAAPRRHSLLVWRSSTSAAQGNNNDGNGSNSSNSNSGNNNPPSSSSGTVELNYSGLFAYHVPTNTWCLLKKDIGPKDDPMEESSSSYEQQGASSGEMNCTIKSRVGHSMLFHPGLRKLFIYGGQRGKEYLTDFFTYDVDSRELEMILSKPPPTSSSSACCSTKPSSGFTQRATIDPDLNEIYVFSGLSKEREKREEQLQNSFWVFNIMRTSWSCVYRNGKSSGLPSTTFGGSGSNSVPFLIMDQFGEEPCPRFAHQIVYDPVRKVHYLFGGNPGRSKDPKMRLDDFWRLKLVRPTEHDLLRQCKLLLRRQKFEELAVNGDSLKALMYLQTELAELIDHRDAQQTKEFQSLTLLLFSEKEKPRKPLYNFIPKREIRSPVVPGCKRKQQPLMLMRYSGSVEEDHHTDEEDCYCTGLANAEDAAAKTLTSDSAEDTSSTSSYSIEEQEQCQLVLKRSQLYDKLVKFFPQNMTQPRINLVDLIPLF